jgi:hypothetical protein
MSSQRVKESSLFSDGIVTFTIYGTEKKILGAFYTFDMKSESSFDL